MMDCKKIEEMEKRLAGIDTRLDQIATEQQSQRGRISSNNQMINDLKGIVENMVKAGCLSDPEEVIEEEERFSKGDIFFVWDNTSDNMSHRIKCLIIRGAADHQFSIIDFDHYQELIHFYKVYDGKTYMTKDQINKAFEEGNNNYSNYRLEQKK